jgi:hypothetical protein
LRSWDHMAGLSAVLALSVEDRLVLAYLRCPGLACDKVL